VKTECGELEPYKLWSFRGDRIEWNLAA